MLTLVMKMMLVKQKAIMCQEDDEKEEEREMQ